MGVALSAGPSAKAGCNNDCGGAKQGACVLGRCVCLPGFDGESCSPQPSNCDPACAKHGVCKFNKCFCNPGWQGSNCSTAVPCKDNCNGKGKCKVWCVMCVLCPPCYSRSPASLLASAHLVRVRCSTGSATARLAFVAWLAM
jgi:hypothetical protein